MNSNAFMIGVAFFGATTLFFGTWVERNGPFWSVLGTSECVPLSIALRCG